jgi:hypothetical protein
MRVTHEAQVMPATGSVSSVRGVGVSTAMETLRILQGSI